MELRKAKIEDAMFVYENLEDLRGDVKYSFEQFIAYYKKYLTDENNWIFIANTFNENIGFISVNIYSSIKYIGYTAELEEVVMVSEMRGKGLGKKFLKKVILKLRKEKKIRKIIVKTDDLLIAGKLYNKEMNLTEMRVFQKFLNKI